MTDYKDHRKKKLRVKKKHLNIFYLFSFAVLLLLTPLIVIQAQQRTNTQSKAAPPNPPCSVRTAAACTGVCKLVKSSVEGVCRRVVGGTMQCEGIKTKDKCPSSQCSWIPKNLCIDTSPIANPQNGTEGAPCDVQYGNCNAGLNCKLNPGATRSGTCTKNSGPTKQADEQIHGKISCDLGHGTCYIRSRMPGTTQVNWHTGKCPGSSAVQCYSDRPASGNPPPVKPPANQPAPQVSSDSQHIGKACSTPQGNGTCQFSTGCGGTRISGFCPGSAAVQCCVNPVGGPPAQQQPVAKTNPNAADYCTRVGAKDTDTPPPCGKDISSPGKDNSCGITRLCCRPADSAKSGACEPNTNTPSSSTPNNPTNPNQPLAPDPNGKMNMQIAFQGIDQNSNPKNPQVTVTIRMYNNVVQLAGVPNANVLGASAAIATDKVAYDAQSGTYKNSQFNLGNPPPGKYYLVAQADKYLDAALTNKADGAGVFDIQPSTTVEAAPFEMRAGDIVPTPRGDNKVSILDYNVVLNCIQGPASICLNRKLADINDDGKVDQKDLDIVRTNMDQSGFLVETSEIKCEPNPTCSNNNPGNTLQLCSLLCTKKTDRL